MSTSFLDRFPPEVRNLVYKFCMPDVPARRGIQLRSDYWIGPHGYPNRNLDRTPARATNLLTLNSQIYNESVGLLYSHAPIVIGLANRVDPHIEMGITIKSPYELKTAVQTAQFQAMAALRINVVLNELNPLMVEPADDRHRDEHVEVGCLLANLLLVVQAIMQRPNTPEVHVDVTIIDWEPNMPNSDVVTAVAKVLDSFRGLRVPKGVKVSGVARGNVSLVPDEIYDPISLEIDDFEGFQDLKDEIRAMTSQPGGHAPLTPFQDLVLCLHGSYLNSRNVFADPEWYHKFPTARKDARQIRESRENLVMFLYP